MGTMKRAALYSRVASGHPSDALDIESQKKKLREFALQSGFEVFTEYADNGFGGLSLDRPAFRQMEADIKSGLIECVIVKSMDRISRDILLSSEWMESMDEYGIRLLAVDGTHDMILGCKFDLKEFIKTAQAYLAKSKSL